MPTRWQLSPREGALLARIQLKGQDMVNQWSGKIAIDRCLHSRFVKWSDDDRITILILCEMFETYGFDAIFARATYMMTPSVDPLGAIERIVFEVSMTFGRKLLSIFRINDGSYMLTD